MAIQSASAKLYTGIRCWCVDKNISANLTASFTTGNKNRPIQVSGDVVYPGILVFRLYRTTIDLEMVATINRIDERYKTYGGGNNVITVNGVDNTRNWKINSRLVCKFPTYIQIDVEKLQLPEGTDCIVEFEEGWITEGDYPGSTFAPSPEVKNFFTFRTPWYGVGKLNTGAFAINLLGLRKKPLSSSVSASSSIYARGVLNPGKFAAIEVATFAMIPISNYKVGGNATIQSLMSVSNAIPLRIKQLDSSVSSQFAVSVPKSEIVIFYESSISTEFNSQTNGRRVRFLQNQNVSASTALASDTFESRIRKTSSSSTITAFQSPITIRRTRPFTVQPINASASMTITANKIGLLYEKLNPNVSGTPDFDYFGWDVAINNTYFAVSAPQEDEGSDNDTGRVYVYNTSNGTLVNTLLGNTYNSFGTPASDYFGSSIAFNPSNSSEIAVGTPYEDNGFTNNGRVNVINASNGSLISTYQLSSAVATGSWEQGQDVDINSNYVVVGSRVRVDVYNRSTGNIAFSLPINIDEAKVAMSGNNIIIGYANDNLAYIYNASTGTLTRTLTGPVASSGFGSSVAINGTFAVVGARNYNAGGYLQVGRVYVYNLSNGALVRTLDYPNPNRDYTYFGGAIAISNTHILVGGWVNSGDGHFHLFEIGGTRIRSWEEGNTGLGDAVAIFGDYFIVGGVWKTSTTFSASGWARVYSLNKP